MNIGDKQHNDLLHELFARFGIAYYYSEELHRGLSLILAFSNLPSPELTTSVRLDEELACSFSLTFGKVIDDLKGRIPDELSEKLKIALEKRNFLAHHFWFDHAHLLYEEDKILGLFTELDEYGDIFSKLDEEMSALSLEIQHQRGITDKLIQESLDKIVNGEEQQPLPDKYRIQELNKKLKGKQRLIRVWECILPNGRKPLVFELQDGTLWDLCDVGLAWSQFQCVEKDWIEQSNFLPFLPADIFLRPKDAKPWNFQFNLKGGAILWVKPGKHPRTFKWGIISAHG